MSEEKNNTTDGSQAAVDYVNKQLDQARAALGRTKLLAVILILGVLAYMTFVTKGILSHLEPTEAARTAKGVIAAQLSERGDAIVGELKQKIPEVMKELPDSLLKRIPTVREHLEEKIENDIRDYAMQTSKTLEPQFDDFLKNHHKDIQDFLDATQDLNALKADLNPDMDKLINDFLASNKDGNESLKDKLDESREMLKQIADRTDRLANAKDLNNQEKQTRRAIAVLLAKADFKLYKDTRENHPDYDPDEPAKSTDQK